jgi:hypothetical protein
MQAMLRRWFLPFSRFPSLVPIRLFYFARGAPLFYARVTALILALVLPFFVTRKGCVEMGVCEGPIASRGASIGVKARFCPRIWEMTFAAIKDGIIPLFEHYLSEKNAVDILSGLT